MVIKKTVLAFVAAGAVGAMVLPLQALAADDVVLARTAPQEIAQADIPVPPVPPGASHLPQGFGPEVIVGDGSYRQLPPPPPARPGLVPEGRPIPAPRPVIVMEAPQGYAPAYADNWGTPPSPRYHRMWHDGRGYGPDCPYYNGGMAQILTDNRYSKQTDEIEKLEDLLYVERNVLRSMQQNGSATAAEIRTQSRTVVDLKNRLDAQYDALMQQYSEDNGTAALPPCYQDGRRPHHYMRHHRNWHHW